MISEQDTISTLSEEPQGVLMNSSMSSQKTAHDSLPRIDSESRKHLLANKELFDKELDLEFPRENIILGTCLGQGAFGKVVQAQACGIVESGVLTMVAVRMFNGKHTNTVRARIFSHQ